MYIFRILFYFMFVAATSTVQGTTEFLLYGTTYGIVRYELKENKTTTVYATNGSEVQDGFNFDYEADTNCVIFGMKNDNSIKRICLSSNNATLENVILKSGYDGEGIAYDWVGKNIIWVLFSKRQILTAKRNGSDPRILIDHPHLDYPVSLALDPYERWMYWTDQSSTNPRIARANMNGNQSTYQVLLQGEYLFQYPFGLTIDHQFENMYWTDIGLNHVMKASLLGENIETIAAGVRKPLGISIHESVVFWADAKEGAIMYSDIQPGHRGVKILIGNISDIINVKVVSCQILKGAPVITVSQIKYSILTGSDIILTCTVSADPALNVVFWQKIINNLYTNLTINRSKFAGSNTSFPSLFIQNTMPSDSGQYRCGAANIVDTSFSPNITLKVSGSAPEVIVKNTSYSQLTGFDTALTCSVSGNPEVTSVFWQKIINGTYANLTISGLKFAGSNTSYPTLIIKSSQPSDSGQYRCGATNQVDTSYSYVIFLAVSGNVPTVNVSEVHYLKTTNSKTILSCSVYGKPAVNKVFWEKYENKNYTIITIDGLKLAGVNLNNPNLIITNSQPNDTGRYRCGATSPVGTTYSSIVYLTVTGSSPQIMVQQLSYSCVSNTDIVMECAVSGSPEISSVFWQKLINAQYVMVNIDRIKMSGSNLSFPSLIIRRLQPLDSGKYQCCATNRVGTSYSSIVSLKVTAIPICPEENETFDILNYTWPRARAIEAIHYLCPNPEYSITRQCLSTVKDTLWENTENKCNMEKDVELASRKLNETSPECVLNILKILSTKAKQFTAKNVNTFISFLENVLNAQCCTHDVNISENVIAVISNIMESEKTALHYSGGSDTRILSIIDKVLETVNISTKPFEVVKPNIAVFVVSTSKDKFRGYTLVTNPSPSGSLNAGRVEMKTEDIKEIFKSSFIKLPESLSLSLSEEDLSKLDRVTFAVYSNGKLFKNSNTNSTKEQKGLILAASLPGMTVENLTQPVVVSIQKPQKGEGECVFWDNTIPGEESWSSRGCKTIDSQGDDFIKCECSHLTNFAMLMDVFVKQIIEANVHNQAISAVSYIGCSISIIGLFLTLSFLLHFRITGSNQYKILINFCFALLGNNLVFIIGQQEYSATSKNGCKVVAVLQHYFLLVCFLWKLVEAYSIYLALFRVFAKYTSRFYLKAAGVGWGVPAVIVFITLIINLSDNYGRQRGDVCWLDTYAFYGAFVSVLAFVFVMNIILFTLVTKRLLHRSGNASSKERDFTKTRLRRVVSVMVLLGITWILGFLPLAGTGGVVVQYIFAILNALQGLLIFVFNCVLNKDVSGKWKNLIPNCKLGRETSNSISGEELSTVTNGATVSTLLQRVK